MTIFIPLPQLSSRYHHTLTHLYPVFFLSWCNYCTVSLNAKFTWNYAGIRLKCVQTNEAGIAEGQKEQSLRALGDILGFRLDLSTKPCPSLQRLAEKVVHNWKQSDEGYVLLPRRLRRWDAPHDPRYDQRMSKYIIFMNTNRHWLVMVCKTYLLISRENDTIDWYLKFISDSDPGTSLLWIKIASIYDNIELLP